MFIASVPVLFTVLLIAPLTLPLAGCGEKAPTLEDLNSTDVTLPNGTKIVCDTMRQSIDLRRGLMFRDALAPGRGMLFIYPKLERHPHWMYQVKFSVDTIWMDDDHTIVEMILNMPPCDSKLASECPTYGGTRVSRFAVEVPAGFVRKNGLRADQKLDF